MMPMPVSVMCVESPRGPCDLFLDDVTSDCTFEELFASIDAHFEVSVLSVKLSFENEVVSPYFPNTGILQYGPAGGITCQVCSKKSCVTIIIKMMDGSTN